MVHSSSAPGQGREPSEIDTSVPNSARIWNYWLGGKDNYPVDRAAGDEYRAVYPEIVDVARASRRFLARAVRYLAGEAGVRQFLDVGTGLPTVDNTHEVAERVADDARAIVDRLLDALPSGSYLAICEGTNDHYETGVEAQRQYNESGAAPYRLRSARQVTEFFTGLELVEPGVVSCPRWRPDPGDRRAALAEMDQVAGVARKP